MAIQRRRPEARPSEVLDAAQAVFTEKGFAAARMDDVARRAGLSKGALYLYFPSKEALFVALVRRFAETAVEVLAARLEDGGGNDPVAALRGAVRFILGVVSDPEASAAPRLVLAEAARFPEIGAIYRREVIDVGRRAIGAIIENGRRQGVFRAMDSEVAIRIVMGPMLVHMLLTHVLVDDRPAPPTDLDAMADTLLDAMLHGLKLQPEETRP
jgi:AcrR family transcriptional regulator